MENREIIATFDTQDTAFQVSKALNIWFSWIMEGDPEDPPDVFDDFGVEIEDFALDRETDIDWEDLPAVSAHGNIVEISIDHSATLDTLEELLESLGAFEVSMADEED